MSTSKPRREPHPEDVVVAPDLAGELKRRGADQLVEEGVSVEQLLFAALRDTLGSARAMSYRRAVFETEQDRTGDEQRAVVSLWTRLSASVEALADALAVATGEPWPEYDPAEGKADDGAPAEQLLVDPEFISANERGARDLRARTKVYRVSAG